MTNEEFLTKFKAILTKVSKGELSHNEASMLYNQSINLDIST
jgi:hypothetical protein